MRGNAAIGLLISKLFDNAFFEVGKKELESNFRIFLFSGGGENRLIFYWLVRGDDDVSSSQAATSQFH